MSTVYLQPTNPVPGAPKKLEFPYTPQIEYGTEVKYDHFNLVHTNYQPLAYSRTENPTISITAKFSSHTMEHFNMCERAIRFLRIYTKMNYGRMDDFRGQPPRILRFYALGKPLFHNVPVVISRFNMTFPEDVDYIKGLFDPESIRDESISAIEKVQPTDMPEGTLRIDVNGVTPPTIYYLPAVFTINITLQMQQNLAQTVNEFSLKKFASGVMNEEGYI